MSTLSLENVNSSILPRKFYLNNSDNDEFIQGKRSTVILTNNLGQEIFRKSFNQHEEFQFFVKNYLTASFGCSFVLAAFVPVRTDSVKDLAKSILFPTLINHFPEKCSFPKKILGSLAGFSFDLLTLIPRIAATPFRIYYNYNTQEPVHPLAEIFKDNPELASSLKNQPITVQTEIQDVILEEVKRDQSFERVYITVEGSVDIEKTTKQIVTNFHTHRPMWRSQSIINTHHAFRGTLLDDSILITTKDSRSSSKKSSEKLELFG